MSTEPAKKPVGRPKKRSMAGTAAINNPGRPRKLNYGEVSYSTLNRRAHEIAQTFDISTLQLALNIAKSEANIVEVTDNSSAAVPHTPETGFALFLENDFSKAQWELLHGDSKARGVNIYPSFYKLSQVKAECRPSVYDIESEVCVQVSFQTMLNKTAERLVNAVGSEWHSNDLQDLTLICAYGFDSSSGFKNPHQKFSDTENVTLKSELSLFATTFTVCGIKNKNKDILWLNPTPQSIRFCRPLRLAVEKETEITVLAERDRLDHEVEHLEKHCFSLANKKNVTVGFQVYLTMVDGKCLNYLLCNAVTTRCPVCSLSMEHFNKPVDWNTIVPASNLTHGMGNLHCEIKTLELLIKLSCRLPLETWTVRKEMAHTKEAEMQKIKTNLFNTFSVRVDEVQHGSGTSINGNSARKCLKDPTTLAKVLGLNEELVKHLAYCVLAFKQKKDINLNRLDSYCTETYKLFFSSYPWAKMNPSVHKMLRHGVSIARQFPLSLAYFAEDAAESMHKCYKKSSVSHARQTSRADRLMDVFNRAVDLSDPQTSIIYLEKRCKKEKEDLPAEFVNLFQI